MRHPGGPLFVARNSPYVLLYEATVSDSRYGSRQAELLKDTLRPIPGARLQFKATAYCKGYTTASGVAVRSGVAAADPEILPVGSVIQADFESDQYDGVYTITLRDNGIADLEGNRTLGGDIGNFVVSISRGTAVPSSI